MLNQKNQTDVMKMIVETVAKLGISLSDGAMKELEKAYLITDEYASFMKEKIAGGMDKNDAAALYFSQMSEQEQSKFMANIEIVRRFEELRRNLGSND